MKNNSKDNYNIAALTSGFFFILAQLLSRGCTFLVTPFYTKVLSVSEYGIMRNYESWLMVAYTVMSLCLWKSLEIARIDFKDNYNQYSSSILTLSIMSIISLSGLSLIFKRQLQSFLEWDNIMFYLCLLYVLTYTNILFFQRREKQLLRYKLATIVTLTTVIPGNALSVFLLYVAVKLNWDISLLYLKLLGSYLPIIIGGVLVGVLIWKQGKEFYNKEYWTYSLKYSIPLIPEAESVQIMNLSDKFMIQKLVGTTEAGIFALPQTFVFIVSILEDSVWSAWIPWLYTKIENNEIEEISKKWISVMHFFGILSWIIVVFAPEEIRIMGRKMEYTEAIYLIAPMVTGSLFRFFSYTYSAIQNYYKKTHSVAFGTVLTMIINILLNYFFIRNIGYKAASYTTMLSFMILLITQGYLEKKITGMRIIPLYKTMIIGLSYTIINIVTIFFYKFSFYWRFLIVLIIFSFLYIMKHYYIFLINKLREILLK